MTVRWMPPATVIKSLAQSKTHFIAKQLRDALADAVLTDTELDSIVEITQQEALARINNATSADKTDYREHRHHGGQYIARKRCRLSLKRQPYPLSVCRS